MKKVPLGRSDLHVTPICLGTMTFGEQVSEADAHAIMDRAVERGIDFLDTAAMYSVPTRAATFGATEAIIVDRRTREKMPAHDFEVEEALQEGVMVKWLSTIKQAGADGALTIEKMVLDAKGNPQPTGEFETLESDSLVLALGQDVDLSLLDGVPGLERQGPDQPRRRYRGHPRRRCGGDRRRSGFCPRAQ